MKEALGGSVALLTALGALAQLLGFGYRVTMSRMVGAEVMGLYQLVMSAYGVIQSLTMIGLTAALCNLTSRYLARQDLRGCGAIRGTCLRVFFCALGVVGTVTVVCSDAISVYCLGDARTRLGLMLLVPCAALTGVENLHKNIFYGAGRPKGPAVAEVVEQLVRAGAVLGLLYAFLPQYPERAVGLIVGGMVLCEVVSAATMLALYHRGWGGVDTGGAKGGWSGLEQVAAIALPVGANALVGTVLGAANSALLPQKLLEGGMARGDAMAQLGVVSGMTMPMLAMPTVFLGAINLVLTPKMAGAHALGRCREVGALGSRGVSAVARLAFPAMGAMVVLGEDLGLALFGREDVGTYLLPLAAATLMSCYCSVLTGILNSVGEQKTVAAVSILGGVVQLVCTMVLTPCPGIGLGGYVFGTVLATGVELALFFYRAVKVTGMRPDWYPWLLTPGLSTALSAACARLLIRWLKGQGVGPVCADVGGVVFALVQYKTALWLLRGGKER